MQVKYPYEQFGEHDTLRITGPTQGWYLREFGLTVKDFRCVVATVYQPGRSVEGDDLYTFKVWPDDPQDPQLPAGHDSKIWFDARTCQIEVLKRAEW